MMTLKELVKGKKVRFSYYRNGELWYRTDDGFEFPVPIADTAVRLSATPGGIRHRAPLLGEHTDEILRQVLGFSDHQVADIHGSGALDPPRKEAAE